MNEEKKNKSKKAPARPVRQAWEPVERKDATHAPLETKKKKPHSLARPPKKEGAKEERSAHAPRADKGTRVSQKAEKTPRGADRQTRHPQPRGAAPAPTHTPDAAPAKHTRAASHAKKKPLGKLKVMSLGGLGEIGKNMTVIEYGNDIVVVDCGFGFPDEDMLGVDYVIPDISYLEKNADRVRGILITHGHEDHIGAIPYVLRAINPPIYGTRLSLGIIKNKLSEHKLPHKPRLLTVEAGDVVQLGVLLAEFIHVNHSIADACALAIRTPLGTVFHSGDFKLDVTPIDGNVMDLTRIGEIGREGVLLMLAESTNAERAGFSPSERSVGGSLDRIFAENADNRLVIATFSSNVHRVQQIIDCSVRHGRHVAVLGRSMENVIGAAVELGYMTVPEGTLVSVGDLRRFRPNEITLVTTGSQGEPMSALYRMAFGSHERVKLTPQDTVILSSSAIPGNELLVDRIINALVTGGIKVVSDATTANVHASGHACSEELKLLHALVRPKYFMPIHGEARHLFAHKKIAEYMGMSPDSIFVSEIGEVLEIDEKGARKNGTVPAGRVLVDGAGVGDVGSIVLRDRRLLSQDGLIVVVATVALRERAILSGPEIVSRGFVYVRESEDMMDAARKIATNALRKSLDARGDFNMLKNSLRDELSRFFFAQTKRSPMILPIVMEA